MQSIPTADARCASQVSPGTRVAPAATVHLRCRQVSDLQALQALIACDAAWAARHLPVLRGAALLMHQTPMERRERLTALGDVAPAVVSANVEVLDREIAHFARLITLLRRARTRLARVGSRTDVSAPATPSAPRSKEEHPHAVLAGSRT